MEAFARNHQIEIRRADEGIRKADYVKPYFRAMARGERFGVYFIFQAMERAGAIVPAGNWSDAMPGSGGLSDPAALPVALPRSTAGRPGSGAA